MQTLFYLGLILVFGAFIQWLSPKMRIPTVVGYLSLGLLIGPEVLNLIPRGFVENSHVITDLALAIIAVLVGATLKFSTLKGRGKEILYITLFQSAGTFLLVLISFMVLGGFLNLSTGNSLLVALLLAAIATATDSAAPLAIVRELRAKGRFSSVLLAIVATDDVVALMMFSLALSISDVLFAVDSFAWKNLLGAIFLIMMSAILGSAAAFINSFMQKLLASHKGMQTIATLGLIFIVYSLSEYWDLEPLLSAMVMGMVMVNTSNDFDIVEEEIDNHLAEVIFMLFFIISAMHLALDALFIFPLAIIVYVFSRLFGKVLGGYAGAFFAGSIQSIQRYMGLALIPQAGVAIGLALSLQKHAELDQISSIILNIVIATTLIHELAGPFFIKYALKKSGECQ